MAQAVVADRPGQDTAESDVFAGADHQHGGPGRFPHQERPGLVAEELETPVRFRLDGVPPAATASR